jgi:carbamoyl-phosphate synthase large subunit
VEGEAHGLLDVQIATLTGSSEKVVRAHAASSASSRRTRRSTPARPSSIRRRRTSTRRTSEERRRRVTDSGREKIMILGGGPNRIGQGIEFDYCCVQAAFALRELGYETIMVNSNPETVSTDYDTFDQLFFEPLTLEDVLNVWESQKIHG